MRDFEALRAFAVEAIPPLLRERGGEMAKEALHEEIERRFADGRPMPESLERVENNGRRRKRNAVAFGMKELVGRGVLEPSAGRRTVRLRKPAHRRRGGPSGAGPAD